MEELKQQLKRAMAALNHMYPIWSMDSYWYIGSLRLRNNQWRVILRVNGHYTNVRLGPDLETALKTLADIADNE